jgi:hypothetical protein
MSFAMTFPIPGPGSGESDPIMIRIRGVKRSIAKGLDRRRPEGFAVRDG